MHKFQREYQKLNNAQRKAVDTIDGPLLVVAGPGTGKTHLLSARVAHILEQPDVTPRNILCLTFTDNAARNMLERLESMIGQPAHHVSVRTFHGFGSDIINQYPDYFTERLLEQAIDELGGYELLRSVFEALSHRNPLSTKVGDEFIFLHDSLRVISWLKHNALAPGELTDILKANGTFFQTADPLVGSVFAAPTSAKYLARYKKLVEQLTSKPTAGNRYGFADYGHQAADELRFAIDATEPGGRYAPLITAWRNAWLEKRADGNYAFKDGGRHLDKMRALAAVYKQYQEKLSTQGLYDFDDMVMEVVHALETYDELRLNLQEQYLYILVDEFQDTNKAQWRIVQALGNNPVNEGKPNIMVVGDPNQAIYAFQGAQTSNVIQFMQSYRDVSAVHLDENYRSTQSILDSALAVIGGDSRTPGEPTIDTKLVARAAHPGEVLEHTVFGSELEQYQWLADKIQSYLHDGYRPDDIAVIAPRHKYLERLMPYLVSRHIPVAYERRENILEAPVMLQLIKMAELVHALATNRQNDADALFSEVLSYPFWNLPTELLVELSLVIYDDQKHWLPALLAHKDKRLIAIARWFHDTARLATTEPLEYILDRLSGTDQLAIDSPDTDEVPVELPVKDDFTSPFVDYYFHPKRLDAAPSDYLAHLGQLATLRHHLRRWKPDVTLYVSDMAEFVRLHRESHLKIVDTNPHTQTTNAVQVMTAFKAKGLEFGIVLVINAQDEVWGPSARDKADKIRLPKNLPIKPAGRTDSDKLRLFFVALTRAKHTLHVTSYTHTLDNKLSLGLSFIGGNSTDAEPVHPGFTARRLAQPLTAEAVQILTTDWAYRYRQIIADKPTLFEPILANYQLSVTHLNNFLDVANGGPQYFLRHNLLRFPEAMSGPAAYGDAVHKTLQWIYAQLKSDNKRPALKKTLDYFTKGLVRKHLPGPEFEAFNERGREALTRYLSERASAFSVTHLSERGFAREGVVIGGARLTGKIDKIVPLDDSSFQVVDFKTGKPARSWKGRDDYEQYKLHRYTQQLLFYKLLVEHSAAFSRRKVVSSGALEFVEADDNGELVPPLELRYAQDELDRFAQLITLVWRHIQALDFPSTESYPKSLKGTLAFEADLLEGKI